MSFVTLCRCVDVLSFVCMSFVCVDVLSFACMSFVCVDVGVSLVYRGCVIVFVTYMFVN